MKSKIVIKAFGKLIAPKVKICIDNGEDNYDYVNEVIHINPTLKEDYGFTRHLYEYHKPAIKLPTQIWTILHEYGHYFTADEFEVDMDTRAICGMIAKEVACNYKEVQDLYFNMEDEYGATEWACAYAEKHPRLCTFFGKIIK